MCASVKERRECASVGVVKGWGCRGGRGTPPSDIDVGRECECRVCRPKPNQTKNGLQDVEATVRALYSLKKRIGQGAYGIVWKAHCKRRNETVAIKKIFDAFIKDRDARMTFREVMYLREFGSHPNIISLLEIHRASNNKDIYLVFEYMDIDLDHLIRKGNVLKDHHKRFITYQLLKAIKFIHSGSVIHRDLKPSNILLNTHCECKIADFGLARSLARSSFAESANPKLTDYVATRWYRPPEILMSTKKYTKGIDMWSLGCIVGEMLVGKVLFPGTSSLHQMELVMRSIPRPSSRDMELIPKGVEISGSPSGRRPLKETLRGCPSDGVDLVRNLLLFNPLKRLSAHDALAHPFVEIFRDRRKEVSLTHPVIPFLRDDIQLSADEYRKTLYDSIEDSWRNPSCNCYMRPMRRLEPVERRSRTKIITKQRTTESVDSRRPVVRPPPLRGGSVDASWTRQSHIVQHPLNPRQKHTILETY